MMRRRGKDSKITESKMRDRTLPTLGLSRMMVSL